MNDSWILNGFLITSHWSVVSNDGKFWMSSEWNLYWFWLASLWIPNRFCMSSNVFPTKLLGCFAGIVVLTRRWLITVCSFRVPGNFWLYQQARTELANNMQLVKRSAESWKLWRTHLSWHNCSLQQCMRTLVLSRTSRGSPAILLSGLRTSSILISFRKYFIKTLGPGCWPCLNKNGGNGSTSNNPSAFLTRDKPHVSNHWSFGHNSCWHDLADALCKPKSSTIEYSFHLVGPLVHAMMVPDFLCLAGGCCLKHFSASA